MGLAISEQNLNSLTPVIQANSASLNGANLAIQFGTYISSSTPAAPTEQTITLIRAPTGQINDSVTSLAAQNALLGQNTPFLFESPNSAGIVPASTSAGLQGRQWPHPRFPS